MSARPKGEALPVGSAKGSVSWEGFYRANRTELLYQRSAPENLRQFAHRTYLDYLGRELGAVDLAGPVVEIGAGRGTTSLGLADRHRSRCLLVDLAPTGLALAREASRHLGAPVEGVVGDAFHLPLRSGFARGACSIGVVEEVPDVDRFFSETFRILAPGGWCFHVAVPPTRAPSPLFSFPLRLLRRIEAVAGAASRPSATMSLLPLEKSRERGAWYAEKARAAGFSKIRVVGFLPHLPLFAGDEWNRRFTLPAWRLFRQLRRLAGLDPLSTASPLARAEAVFARKEE
jgi:ubiquinone/menaquinone biosynthesis C-methylase UbiE